MIGFPVHYFQNRLHEPDTPRAAIITGTGARKGEVNVCVFMDRELDAKRGVPNVVLRENLAVAASCPPGVREWVRPIIGLTPETLESTLESAVTADDGRDAPPAAADRIKGPLAAVIPGQVSPKAVLWKNGTGSSYQGADRETGMPLFLLTKRADGDWRLNARTHRGRRGPEVARCDDSTLSELIVAAEDQAHIVMSANLEAQKEEAGEAMAT